MRGDCSCCCYWWNYCPSLFTISFFHCEFSIYLNYINASIHVRIVCLAKMNKKHTMFTVNFDAANTIQLSLLCTSTSQLQYFTFHNGYFVHMHDSYNTQLSTMFVVYMYMYMPATKQTCLLCLLCFHLNTQILIMFIEYSHQKQHIFNNVLCSQLTHCVYIYRQMTQLYCVYISV